MGNRMFERVEPRGTYFFCKAFTHDDYSIIYILGIFRYLESSFSMALAISITTIYNNIAKPFYHTFLFSLRPHLQLLRRKSAVLVPD